MKRKIIIIGLALLCLLVVVFAAYGVVQFCLKHVKVPFGIAQSDHTEKRIAACQQYLTLTSSEAEK